MERIQKVAIIGAGNMGSAIAGGILKHSKVEVCVANRGQERLDRFNKEYKDYSSRLLLTGDFSEAVKDAELTVIAVKPWAFEETIQKIKGSLKEYSTIVSVAAGCGLSQIEKHLENLHCGKIHMIPNTAIRIGKGMTFAACKDVDNSVLSELKKLFAPMTKLEIIEESKMPAAMALCSCGIAYAYKFIAAAAQAGVELGLGYEASAEYFAATIAGAAAMVEATGKDPQTLINEVTTPGGLTIKGINSLEKNGFPSAVIEAVLTPVKQ